MMLSKYQKLLAVFVLLWVMAQCKTPEPARVYTPVFDQTTRQYVKTTPHRPDLDTSVLIRSNVLENLVIALDTISLEEQFTLESAELAVPLELINEKPPLYDTFLVVADYRYPASYVDLLFPVIPLAIIEAMTSDQNGSSDTLHPEQLSLSEVSPNKKPMVSESAPSHKASKKPSIFLSKKERLARKNRKEIDKILALKQAETSEGKTVNVVQEEVLADTILAAEPLVVKEIYTRDEILADTTRDLLDATNILDQHLSEVAWKIGDSIPFYHGMDSYFLDSSLIILYDTVYVEVIDSSRMVPQLSFDSLTNIQLEKLELVFRFYVNERLIFKVFHPEIDDVFIDMIRVQGGDFKLGNNEFDDDERPATALTVSSFLLSQYEVTNKLFCYFLDDQLCDSLGQIEGIPVIDLDHPETRIQRNRFTGKFTVSGGYDEYPVVNVTWIGAQMFCKYAGGRLPSEAEWEYAARGGIYARRFYLNAAKTDYDYVNRYAGGNYLGELGWFVDNSRGQVWVGGRKHPNELGLYDMSGNVWEWCYDKYSKDAYKRINRSRNPMFLEGGNLRVNRGGSWSSDALYCRVSNRNFLDQYGKNQYLGFRLMREW
ncbi:MAG: SUMF1/EgtB/PvdO family nonheme iron enzyme [Prolixibacteraceae bacterium]|nr:SUMF1/EgtB/PvdO family nonheme iron enzyme [Prolixibacteraceae bacterium]